MTGLIGEDKYAYQHQLWHHFFIDLAQNWYTDAQHVFHTLLYFYVNIFNSFKKMHFLCYHYRSAEQPAMSRGESVTVFQARPAKVWR